MSAPETLVAADRFEVAAGDTLLLAQLQSAVAVCVYDTIEAAGALLHLRVVLHGRRRTDMTDFTLASELLLLERCLTSLREAAPAARHLQARVVAHSGDSAATQSACESVLGLLRQCLVDAGVEVLPDDVSAGAPRQVRFRPAMGWVHTRD